MKAPDGRNWEKKEPPFLTVENFRECKEIVSHRGELVSARVESWGGYRPSSTKTDIFSLFAPDDVDATISLPEAYYDVFTLVDGPAQKHSASSTYFSYLGSNDLVPNRWEYLSQFGSDTYNMTLSDPSNRKSLCDFIDRCLGESSDTTQSDYSLLSDLSTEDHGKASSVLLRLGLKFSTIETPGPIAVFPTSKIATMFVGFQDDVQVALQARWL